VLPTIGRFRVSSDSSPSARSCSGSPFLDFHSAMPSPFPMAQDLPPSNEDRISHLEATIDDLRSQSDVTKTILQSILDKLGAPAPHIPALSPILPMSEVKPFTPLSLHTAIPQCLSRQYDPDHLGIVVYEGRLSLSVGTERIGTRSPMRCPAVHRLARF